MSEIPPYGAILTPPQAEAYVGGDSVLDLLRRECGLTPLLQGPRRTRYSRQELDDAVARLRLAGQQGKRVQEVQA